MKRLFALVGLVVLTACGSKTVYITDTTPATEAPVETTTTVAPAPAPTRPQASYNPEPSSGGYDEAGFFGAVIVNAPTVYSILPDSDILNIGLIICEQFDAGMTLTQVTDLVLNAMAGSGTLGYMDEIAAIEGAAIVFLCPEYAFWLDTI